MAKQSPADKVAQLDERLSELRREGIALTVGLEQITAQLGALVASDSDDLQQIAELRRELAIDRQRLPEIEAAIPVVERQLATALEEARRAEEQVHRRAAWTAAAKRADVAAAIDAKLAEAGALWAQLVELTEQENQSLRAAGGGTSSAMVNRLKTIVPAVLWKHLGPMLAAARFERIPSARWQTLASSITRPADAA